MLEVGVLVLVFGCVFGGLVVVCSGGGVGFWFCFVGFGGVCVCWVL